MLNAFAPPFRVVAIYFIFAFIYLVGFAALSFGGFSLALLHAFFAGFALNIITGALYQLSSVIYERAFCTVRGVFACALAQNIGVAALLCGMYQGAWDIAAMGGGVVIAFNCYFLALFFISFFRTRSFAQLCLILGVGFLCAGALCAGILLGVFNAALSAIYYEMALRFHIYFMLGFVYLISLGSASVLLPMFLLSHKCSLLVAKIALALYLLAALALIFSAQIACIIAAFSLLAALIYCLILLAKRSRKKLDIYNCHLALFVLSGVVCALFLAFSDLESALKVGIFGLLFSFIGAHAYKILPFLVWYHFVSPFVGKCKVPILNDLINSKLAYLALIFNTAALLCASGVLERYLAFCVAFLVALLVLNMLNAARYINYKGEL